MFGSQGTINNDTSTDYHRCAIEIAEEFKKRSKDRSKRIENILNTNRAQQIKDNRERLKPIIKLILFCGRNGLALRGHRDYGIFTLDQPTEKYGNLHALLRFRAESGEVAVSEKILTAPKNARYLHYEIQNEIIHILGDQIINVLLKRINDSEYFSVLADETTDISGIEQLNICICYYYNSTICEDFLTFLPVYDLTGKSHAKSILDTLKGYNINLNKMIGQGYDGASAMSGEFKGVQSEIRRECPTALFVHCSSHCLNISLSKGSIVQAIRNTVGTMSEVITFINASAKRLHYFIEKT